MRAAVRVAVALWVALAALLIGPSDVHAGSYLDRATLLVESARKDGDFLRARLTDKELARVIHKVAEARFNAASKMDVPVVVAKAHPHLLLVLGHVERAALAAIEGNYKNALEQLEAARREEQIFRSALKEAGHALPSAALPSLRAVRSAGYP